MQAEKIKNIEEMIDLLNPDEALDETFDDFYVDRGETSPIQEMIQHLLIDSNFPKLLFTGPKGCGKETELIKLSKAPEIKKHFHVKIIAGKDDAGKLINEIMNKVVEIAKEIKLDISDITHKIEEFKSYLLGWSSDTELIGTFEKEVPESVISFGKLKPDEKKIKITRKKSGGTAGPAEFKKFISQLTEEIYWKKKRWGKSIEKEVLILVTNLDKIDKKKAETLFQNKLLSGIACFVVYTFPFELTYQSSFAKILRNFSEVYHLTNFELESEDEENNIEKLREILMKRIDIKLFNPPEIIDDLIKYSGGVPYELFRLIKECAILARKKNPQYKLIRRYKINYEVLDEIIRRKKILYQNTFGQKQKDVLKAVINQEKPNRDDADFVDLLNQNLIIQYGPYEHVWDRVHYKVNPIITEIFPELLIPEEKKEEEKTEENSS